MKRTLALLAAHALVLLASACLDTSSSPQANTDAGDLPDARSGDALSGDTSGGWDGTLGAPGQWSWHEVAGSACGNGTTAGIGVRPGTDPAKLVMFFAGGGACWDTASCYVFNAAVNIEVDYGAAQFAAEIAGMESVGVFQDLTGSAGPLAGATIVYVPYCTADLHGGDSVGKYDPLDPERRVHHRGAANVEAYLRVLRRALPDLDQIHVLGISAGGYGAMLNLERIRSAYPAARVHALADCSPMVQPREGRWGAWQRAWNLALPDGCEGCATRFGDLATHVIAANPDSRIGLLAYEDDAIITVFFAHELGQLGAATRALITDAYAPDNAAAFVLPGTEHVMLGHYDTLAHPDGHSLRDFVRAWASGQGWGEAF